MSSTLKCLETLAVLSREPYEFAVSDIARELGQPLTTAHRLLSTLVEAGYAEQDRATRRYRIGGKALWTGAAYLRHSPVYRAAFLVMQEAARESAGLIHLGALDGDWVLYLHTVGSPSRTYLYADTGERRHLHSTGLGKAMLAWQPSTVVNRIAGQKMARFTRHTITNAAELKEELKKTRQRGYAVDDEEGLLGLRCVAAPIFDRAGVSVAALSMSAPVGTLTREVVPDAAATVREAAMKISMQLGYRPASSNMLSLVGG